MANPFDQFDTAPPAASAASNPFDQFDTAAPASKGQERSVMDKLLGRGGERIQLWPERLARSIGSSAVDAATLPRDVMQGKLAPMSPEGIARATNFATMASPAVPMGAGIRAAAKAIPGAAAPTREELHEAATGGYKELKELNAPLRKDVVEDLSNSIREKLNEDSFYAEDQPRTFRALERLKNPVGEDSTAAEVYAARSSLNHVLTDKSLHPSDAAAATIAIEHLDDYLSNIPGFAETAQKARGNYRAAKQSERVTEAQERGQLNAATSGSGANLDNTMRQRIKALLINKKIPKTPEEEALMNEVARGGKLTNIARLLSKLGPKHPITGWGSALAADVGGGSGAATATLAIGALAQYIAERGTGGAISRLDEAIRRNSPLGGGPPAMRPGRVMTPPAGGAALAVPAVDALAPSQDSLSPSDPLAVQHFMDMGSVPSGNRSQPHGFGGVGTGRFFDTPSENIEDRRGENDPYAHMLATNQAIRKGTTNLELGFDKLRPKRQSGRMHGDAGYYDVLKAKARAELEAYIQRLKLDAERQRRSNDQTEKN